jgi:DnaJ-class molecular chaperone
MHNLDKCAKICYYLSLPPYSFASVDVKVPTFEAIDDARRRLGMGETATRDEVKRAYHRVAGKLHPDHNVGDPQAEERMAEVSKAYKLLTVYAKHVQRSAGRRDHPGTEERGGGGAGEGACSFSREAVEQTLLITVKRQELPPVSGQGRHDSHRSLVARSG